MNQLSTALEYATDVRSGKIVVGGYARKAIERHFNDLKNAKKKGFFFNEKAAQKALTFFDFLSLSKGDTDGAAFKLEPWQSFIIASIFGWQKLDDGKRRFTEAYIELSKKNGKTTTAAGVGLYCMAFDNENGPEVYAAAYTRDQASICFDEAVAMVERSPALNKRVNKLKYNLSIPTTRAKFNAVSHDAKNTEGKNAHCVLFDEYHVHTTDGVKVSLQSGMAARTQPLFFIITTAGDNKQGPCYKYREICTNVLEGKTEIDNIFAMIHGIDEGDDWRDEQTWIKANPNIGVSVRMPFLRGEFKKALLNGRAEVEFKTKHLNMWVDAAVTWIPSETWNIGAMPDFTPPTGAICYGGIDLGRSNDISSYALYFPEYNYLTVKHYVASEAAEYAARGGIDYKEWINAGYLTSTEGKTTDYEYIINDIFDDADKYEIRFIGIDPYSAQMFKDRLRDELGSQWAAKKNDAGVITWGNHARVQNFRQGFLSISPPTMLLEELVTNETLKHDGNPVTGWMLGNVVLTSDAAGNIKPTKEKSKDKIDGVVAGIMAIGEYSEWHHHSSSNNDIPAC